MGGNMITDSELVKTYIPIVDFIAESYGETCEVILHDLSRLESSVVYLKNGHLTGREIGDTITDFGLKILHNIEFYKNKSYVDSYIGKKGDKTFRSSTLLIRNNKEKIVGFLCVNIDISSFYDLFAVSKNLIKEMVPQDGLKALVDGEVVNERFMLNTQELIETIANEVIAQFNVDSAHLSLNEKKEIVKQLDKKGVFLLKGSVNEVAQKLTTSPQTIYRYIKELSSL